MTMVADSGATLYLDGERHEVRSLSPAEVKFLGGIDDLEATLNKDLKEVLLEQGLDPAICPKLYIEKKGIATNLHFREILTAYGERDGSNLDKLIGARFKARMQSFVEQGPRDSEGDLTFKTLDGPATVEVKVAKVNKGQGLQALAKAAVNSSTPPSAIIFSGDDVSKGNGTPGTDYYAMVEADAVARECGVPVLNIHTHHPKDGSLRGAEPDPAKAIDTLSDKYPPPHIDLTLPTPAETGGLIVTTLRHETSKPLLQPKVASNVAGALPPAVPQIG